MAELREGAGTLQILSEAHGPHWVAWVARPGERKPLDAVLLVGQTREEAESRAQEWAKRHAVQPPSP